MSTSNHFQDGHTQNVQNFFPSYPFPHFPCVSGTALGYYFSTIFNYSAAAFSPAYVQFVTKSFRCYFPVRIWKQGRDIGCSCLGYVMFHSTKISEKAVSLV